MRIDALRCSVWWARAVDAIVFTLVRSAAEADLSHPIGVTEIPTWRLRIMPWPARRNLRGKFTAFCRLRRLDHGLKLWREVADRLEAAFQGLF